MARCSAVGERGWMRWLEAVQLDRSGAVLRCRAEVSDCARGLFIPLNNSILVPAATGMLIRQASMSQSGFIGATVLGGASIPIWLAITGVPNHGFRTRSQPLVRRAGPTIEYFLYRKHCLTQTQFLLAYAGSRRSDFAFFEREFSRRCYRFSFSLVDEISAKGMIRNGWRGSKHVMDDCGLTVQGLPRIPSYAPMGTGGWGIMAQVGLSLQ
ncbi:hypothetical protein P152DRAFT_79096 [Eremomyces bilateralis CBS 781.70]|uniref:Uncharacterized protein n=1 Tax=Eremomyces bilateralis CBS 781.70 TaxID=1392243 RepID=A0A6G1FZ16_9PEZI|nr:uncharacterized protein P152DRAFT_79096 [Eremomyces bilateralis CBS 781.70]KAF1811115.1 hypothetical protein P152DRAFT_79096 [Eremomyces bilateralis CBS 781.70]